ncbi:Clp protease ClpP [Eubacteriaceae bacterium ES2]|nr:Clp protease ClpP [Eubacteriaceae bacterium ES2]
MAIKKYYSLEKNETTADIYIYGDITSWPWLENDVSSYCLAKELETLEVEKINCYINSYGGEVAEGLAIYNQLKRHSAKVTTICDGFACSAASVIFMAGDERMMGEASLLMVHNAWSSTSGNAEELRKQADDLDTITSASINAYLSCVNIEEKELKKLLDEETWILPEDAVAMNFATGIMQEEISIQASQSVKQKVIHALAMKTGEAVFSIDTSENVEKILNDIKNEMFQKLDEIKNKLYQESELEEKEAPKCKEKETSMVENLVAVLSGQKG